MPSRMLNGSVTITEDARKQLLEQFGHKLDTTKSLNLGCGFDKIQGYINIDADPKVQPDTIINFDQKDIVLPFEDGYFTHIYAAHILEHIVHLADLKKELTRIAAVGCKLLVVVPHYQSPDAWGDDTHVRGFSEQSFMSNFWHGWSGNLSYVDGKLNAPALQQYVWAQNKWIVAYMTRLTQEDADYVLP